MSTARTTTARPEGGASASVSPEEFAREAALRRWRGGDGPLVIAGPCSAETPEQLDRVAAALTRCRVRYLRAGIWKARTRPDTFEGIGDPALGWLREAGRAHGLETATEVATGVHVERALEAGIDALWIGARTTGNPFSVQEIADALRGTDCPVWIKNPMNPDLGLWLGAIERVSKASSENLAVIHRGFSTADRTRFRNRPMWDMVIELRSQLPDTPIINDPSHIAGRRDYVQEIAQRAMDLGLDGLMIETHPDPDHAWSDAPQQITPDRLEELLGRLKIRRTTTDEAVFNATLEELRAEIDRIDGDVIDALVRRMDAVERIADCKRANNVAALQMERWSQLLADRIAAARARGLRGSYIRALYRVIHRESIRRQSDLMNE